MIKIKNNTKYEDTIIFRKNIEKSIKNKKRIEVDLNNVDISTAILIGLFFDILSKYGITNFEKYIKIKNIKNKNNINRVIYGTSFMKKEE